MGINLLAPGASLSTATLIADSVAIPGGSTDGAASLTKNNGNPVSVALELQSVLGGLLLPRMTTTQMTGLNTVSGMILYNSTLGSYVLYNNGAWMPFGGGYSAAVVLTPANIVAMNGAAIQILPAPGAGNVILVNQLFLDYTFNTAAYTGGGAIALQYTAGVFSAANAATASIAASEVTAAANNIATSTGQTNIASATAINAGVYISNATGAFVNPGTAAGTLSVKVSYTIVPAV